MNKWWLLFILTLILLLATWLRLFNLRYPPHYLFDEDLHAYTAKLLAEGDMRAFQWWHPPFTTQQSIYTYRPPAIEWLHPPLAKYFQAISISLLGDQPLAWRLPSVAAGVGLILAIGLIGQQVFSRWSITFLAMSVAAVEHLLVVQSRIASADIFLTLFSTLALAFFAGYQRQRPRWLLWSSVCVGLAMASKWSGVLTLLAIFVLTSFTFILNHRQKRPFTRLCLLPTSQRQLIVNLLTVTIMPICIYVLSYVPPLILGVQPTQLVELQQQAWTYHTTNRAFHPNSSPAYLWPFNQKPVWYFFDAPTSISIVAKQTPIIWLGGVISVLLSVLSLITAYLKTHIKKSRNLPYLHPNDKLGVQFLLVSFVCLWAPWLLVQRPTFLYHYLPCVPLLIVLLSFWLIRIIDYVRSNPALHHPSK